MAYLTGKDLARSYGAEDIFNGVTISIPQDARIALVGPNGAGKTSLLRLVAGVDKPDEGGITTAKDLRIGYLPQDATWNVEQDTTLWEQMLIAFTDLRILEQKLADMAHQMAEKPDDINLIEVYGVLQHRFEERGGYDYEVRIGQVLSGLGLTEDMYDRPIATFSGGQKTRAFLARLLLESPDLLILDEPTNHLDITAIEWLEKWLGTFRGGLLVVSHDRSFMDNVCTYVWELIFGTLEEYRGNYSHYVQQREERHERLEKEYRKQQEFIAKEQEYIRRNIAGQNTKQAQGRRKRLERFLEDDAIHRPQEKGDMTLRIQAERRSGDEVIKTKDLVVGYDEPLFSVKDIILWRGECAALIGPNGAGKSTFLKTVLGQLEPLNGVAKLGASVDIGYFAQAHEELNPQNTILSEIMDYGGMMITEARSYLGQFLFTGDDHYKRINTLSGGERGRVALAKLALSGANLLLLDEPTNHLDVDSQEILEAVLKNFEGTIVLVSHDRYLIRELATQIWSIEPEKHMMHVHKGSYDDYVAERDGVVTQLQKEKTKSKPKPKQAKSSSDKPELTPYQLRQKLQDVEAAINQLEIDMVNIHGELEAASANGDVAATTKWGNAYTETEKQLENLMQEWEDLMVELQT